jgi:hypothetical protein
MLESNERIAQLDDLYSRLMQIIEERAVAFGDDPLGQTGLYTRSFEIKGSREFPVIVERYSRERRLLRELAKLRKQAAIEVARQEKIREASKGRESLEEYQAKLDAGMQRVEDDRRFWREREAAGLEGNPPDGERAEAMRRYARERDAAKLKGDQSVEHSQGKPAESAGPAQPDGSGRPSGSPADQPR